MQGTHLAGSSMGDAATPAVGIDLGTVFSVVAYVDQDGKPCTIPNAEGDLTTPSVVWFHEEGVVVGKEAVKAARHDPDRVAAFAKRDMGEAYYARAMGGERLPPEVVQSLVLGKLRSDAELMLGPFEKAVITVPAYFNEPRRKATQDAGRLAGLEVIDIINEPTAAAIAYGVRHGYLSDSGAAREPETVLVYDLGGGTFDVTVMRIDGFSYETVATAGDVYLGGIDWDSRIVRYLAEQFIEQHGLDPRDDPRALARLLQEAEDAKRALSVRSDVWLTFDHHDLTARTRLTREKFEELSADLLDRTRFTMHRVLREAGLHWDDVTRVLLTGGSTRMPMVRAMVEKETGRRVDRSVSVDEAVAHGAAIYAGILLARAGGERPNVSVTNVNSHDLGVLGIEPATGRRRRKVLIPRNTPLPATYGSRFVTHVDNQRTVAVPVIEGGDASGQHATTIGKCVVKNLPKRLPKGTTVVVNFTYTENGRLTVNASLPDFQNASATMSIERARGLSDEQIAQWCERITAGLRVGQASSAPSPEAAEALPEDSHFDDADATIFDDIDTIEDADAPNEFLASLGRQRPAEPPEKPKSKAGTKAKDPTPSPPPKMPPLPKKEKTDPPPPPPPLPKAAPDAAKSGDAKIDEPPRKTDEKVDEQVAPDDDDELGRFLRGLK